MKGASDRTTRSATKAHNLEETTRATPIVKPRLKFDGVVIEKPKVHKDVYQPPMIRNKIEVEKEVGKSIEKEEPVTMSREESNSRLPESRPFDEVQPLEVRLIPRNTPKEVPLHTKHVTCLQKCKMLSLGKIRIRRYQFRN